MAKLFILLVVLFFSGCESTSLVTLMKEHGVTHENTSKIVLHGSEGDVGADISLQVTEDFLIQGIWDTIYQSRPYTTRCACGDRKAEFYVKKDSLKPALVLWINGTDACHIDSDSEPERFRCPNLDSLVMDLLKGELERK